jgi:hypothetical protein
MQNGTAGALAFATLNISAREIWKAANNKRLGFPQW